MSSITIAMLMIKRTIGKPKGLILYVLFPVAVISVLISLFGSAAGEPQTVLLVNKDQGQLGAELAAALAMESPYKIELRREEQPEALNKLVMEGRAGAAVFIPANYTAMLLEGKSSPVRLMRKSEELWNARLAVQLQTETETLFRLSSEAAASGLAGGQQLAAVHSMLEQMHSSGIKGHIQQEGSNGDGENNTLVVGLMLLFIMLLTNQSIYLVVEDREKRTMLRMFTAPVRAGEIAAGNFLASIMLGTLQLVLIVIVMYNLIGYDMGISAGRLLLVMECFLLSSVGIATSVASMVKSVKNLGYINNLVVTPTCILGGCFWPIGLMPDFMQKLSSFTPQRWAILAFEESSGGAALGDIALHLGIMLLIAAVLLAFGAAVLQPTREAVH